MLQRGTELTIFPAVRARNDESSIHANRNTYCRHRQAYDITSQVRRRLGLRINEVWPDTWRRLQAGSFEELLQGSHRCMEPADSCETENKEEGSINGRRDSGESRHMENGPKAREAEIESAGTREPFRCLRSPIRHLRLYR